MKEFEFEGSWRKFMLGESLEDHRISLTANAQKIADRFGAMPPRLSKPTRIGAYYMIFPYDPGSPGAALSFGGVQTLSGQQREISMNKAKQAAEAFVEFLKQDGSPVDQGALGIDDGIASFKVFLVPF